MSQLVPRGPSSLDTYEEYEANMYDWSKSDKGLILPLESFGLPGVQTTTTPTLTLTPTTMRSFAADLLNGALDDEQTPYHNEAGFVPPIVHPASTYVVDSKSWQGGSVTTMLAASVVSAVSTSGSTATTATVASNAVPVAVSTAASTIPTLAVSPPLPSPTPAPSRKNTGGRRPNKSNGISPEEEERRQMRRDRNKAAAARCRKRRLDQTMTLEKETSILESKKMFLQSEIQELTNEVKELEYLLETHVCCLPRSDRCASPLDIKPAIYDLKQEQELKQQQESIELREPPMKRPMMSVPPPPLAPPVQSKPNRPTTLPVSSHNIFRSTASEIAGISITTPSTVIGLNFKSLMDGGTGLTPVSGPLVPSCSSQQRNHNGVDLGSPDSNITNKLVSL